MKCFRNCHIVNAHLSLYIQRVAVTKEVPITHKYIFCYLYFDKNYVDLFHPRYLAYSP